MKARSRNFSLDLLLLALALASCRRCGQKLAGGGDAGAAPAVQAQRPPPPPPPPPKWERKVGKLDPLGAQVSAAQIVIAWKGTNQPWVPKRARNRTLEEARTLADEVAAKARAGADFANLAVQYSDWPGASQKIFAGYRGRLGLLSESTKGMPEAFARVFKLHVGEVSEPVPSPFGLHIFKRLPAIRLSEILISHEGAGQFHAPRTKEEAQKIAADIEAELKAGKSFADEAFAHSDDMSSAGRGGDIGAFENAASLPAAFREAATALKPGEVSPPFDAPMGVVILRRTE